MGTNTILTRRAFCCSILIVIAIGFGCAKKTPSPVSCPPTPSLSEKSNSDLYYKILSGRYWEYAGDPIEAQRQFDRIMKEESVDADTYYQCANFWIGLSFRVRPQSEADKLVQKAVEICEDGLMAFPENIKLRELLIELYINEKNYFSAIFEFEKLRKIMKPSQQQLIDLVRLYLHTSQSAEALTLANELAANPNPPPELVKVFGLIYAAMEQFEKAIDYYRDYLDKNPDDYESQFNMALCYRNIGSNDRAEHILTRMLNIWPSVHEIRLQLAEILEAENRFEEVIDILRPVTSVPHLAIESRVSIGRMFLIMKNFSDAEKWFREALTMDGANRLALYYLGVTLSELGRHQEALDLLGQIIEQEPISIPIISIAAEVEKKMGNLLKALRLAEKAIKAYPRDPRPYMLLAELYGSEEYSEKAINAYERGLKNIPDDRELTLSLALLLEKKGQWKRAVKEVEKLFTVYPDDTELYNFVGYTLADHNQNLKQAEKLIRKALAREPTNPAYLDSMGWVYYRQGKYEDALDFLEQAIDQMPKDPLLLDHLADTYLRLNRREDAVNTLERILEITPDDERVLEKLRQLRN